MTKPFGKVAIIGCGLIGSSLARAIKKHGLADSLSCGDVRMEVCQKALSLNICDQATTDLSVAVTGADLVIIAVPVGAAGMVAQSISAALSPGAIVTDVGSVKQAVIDAIAPHLPPPVHFVPAHPIAGTEHSGPEAGFAELFQNRWSILTPLPTTAVEATEKVAHLWQAIGAQVEVMDAQRHDRILGITSHLPHLIAYSIVDTAATMEETTQAEVIKYSAGGFRDFTRIAASDPVMWRDIFLNNREAVLETLQRFSEDLTALQKAVRTGDGDKLQAVFTRARTIRRAILEANKA